jgi:hypothetical protein
VKGRRALAIFIIILLAAIGSVLAYGRYCAPARPIKFSATVDRAMTFSISRQQLLTVELSTRTFRIEPLPSPFEQVGQVTVQMLVYPLGGNVTFREYWTNQTLLQISPDFFHPLWLNATFHWLIVESDQKGELWGQTNYVTYPYDGLYSLLFTGNHAAQFKLGQIARLNFVGNCSVVVGTAAKHVARIGPAGVDLLVLGAERVWIEPETEAVFSIVDWPNVSIQSWSYPFNMSLSFVKGSVEYGAYEYARVQGTQDLVLENAIVSTPFSIGHLTYGINASFSGYVSNLYVEGQQLGRPTPASDVLFVLPHLTSFLSSLGALGGAAVLWKAVAHLRKRLKARGSSRSERKEKKMKEKREDRKGRD